METRRISSQGGEKERLWIGTCVALRMLIATMLVIDDDDDDDQQNSPHSKEH